MTHRPLPRVVLAALASLCACGGAEPGAPVTEAPSVAREGVYFVPPRAPSSTYAVRDVTYRVEGGVARLDYTLPALLVGRDTRVSFRGAPDASGGAALTGEVGTATCARTGAGLRCDERFTGLRVDLEGVRREALRLDPGAVDARVAVSQRFSIEPIGVLEVP